MVTVQDVTDGTAAQVRATLAAKRVNRKQLAATTGISYRTLCRRLDGDGEFTLSELFEIAGAIGVRPSDLLPPVFAEAAVA